MIDTTAPNVTLTAPANNSYTNNTEPTFSGAAGQVTASTTASADSTTVTVKIYADATTGGALVQTLTTTESGGSWSVAPTIALAANAQYTAHASQSDGAGNAGFSGTSTFVIDTMNPAVTLTAPANGATGVGLTPTFSGAAGQVAASSTTSADNTTVTVYLCTGSQTSCGSGSGSLIQTLSTVNTFTTGNDTFTVSNPGTQTAGTSFSVTITAKLPGATGPASCPARSARRPRT